jgi:penicillin-binding protein 2
MLESFARLFKKNKKYKDIDPDEIFLDSQNLPNFNVHQFEGLIEKPISRRAIILLTSIFLIVGCVFMFRVWNLQIISGAQYKVKSENNRLKTETIFANRGMILDRNNNPLAWNDLNPQNSDFALREYATTSGISTILGYVKYPTKDSSGNYYQLNFVGKDGIEKNYGQTLAGQNGTQLSETDAMGNVTSQSIVVPPKDGTNVILSIDKDIQKKVYESMIDYANRAGYQGGAGLVMDIHTGELVALANFPEYDSNVMTDGSDVKKIQDYLQNKNNPFLDRAVSGLYTPGSIMKPFVAMGVLTEGVIDPLTQILSTGSISVPNPYDKTKPSIFKDWKALGYVDLRHALAMSSDVYFYEVGGGFQNQKGIGIDNIKKYLQLFGFGQKTGFELGSEPTGVIPDPTWKALTFNGEPWRVGDTYNTAIGQYGVQITPLQAIRAVSAIANGGNLILPSIIKTDPLQKTNSQNTISLDSVYFKIVQEGMRLAVTNGTVTSLNVPYVQVAAKSGTAQVGISKTHVNSWVIGYFPADHPKYAFTIVMENGPSTETLSASMVMREVLDYMSLYKSDYFK